MAVVGVVPAHDGPTPLPTRRQIDAVAALPVDGLGIDIESTARRRRSGAQRRRVVELSAELRAAYPGEVLSAIVLPPVVTEVYGTYWGTASRGPSWRPSTTCGSPWATGRTARSSRAGATPTPTRPPTSTSSARPPGRPDAIVHPVGGIGCCEGPTVPSTPADIAGMVLAAHERGAPGASLYDYVTTGDDLWAPLQAANGL